MLRDLRVRNLAVLAEAGVRFGPGLNVLTGETGAGKSLVVDSLALLAGARASSDLIRTGAETLLVTGVFEPAGDAWRGLLERAGVPAEDEAVMVRREINREGRNRVFVNDQPITLRLLGELAPHLLQIHVQREELGLTDPERQRELLDRSEGDAGKELPAAVAERYRAYRELAGRLERLAGDERLRLERIDLLRFQAREIDAARPVAGEDEELRAERDLLRHSEAITRALGGALELLFEEEGAAAGRLHQARQGLVEIDEWLAECAGWRSELEELEIRLDEVVGALRRRLDAVDADPARLDAVEERLATIERLCRKYGGSSAEVLAHRERIGRELDDLLLDDAQRGELEGEVEEALELYREAALELSAARREWGESLAGRIHAELADLAMKRARFAVRLERERRDGSPLTVDGVPVEISAHGVDGVVFELAANPGEEARPLSRVASGGELSRVYLALQLAVRGRDAEARPTLVFDEVDAGVGGAEAAALGRKLQRLARSEQILVVTHLPQVASFGDQHFKVTKRVDGGRTRMEVAALDAEGRVQEIARMLAGREVTELSRSHAEELIAVAGREP